LPGRGADDETALRAVPGAIAGALDADDRARQSAERLRDATRAVVLGRGYEYATAREWALKLQELTHVMAGAWSSADFEHGPLALLEPGFPVLAVVPDDAAGDGLVPLLRRVRVEHRAELVVVSARRDVDEFTPLRAAGTLPPWLGPIASIVPGQLFAYHMARARGLDTEQPRSISKVTRTR
jgi:glutamine---fructose-6-phosphate transaminase (isomerizing)